MARPAYEDTDPDLRTSRPGMLAEAHRRPARARSLFLPLGVLSILVLGVHAAADSFADWSYFFIDWGTGLVESVFGWMAELVLSDPDERKRALADVFGFDAKRDVARWMALGVELALVVRLGAAALGANQRDDLYDLSPKSDRLRDRLLAFLAKPIRRLSALFKKTGGYLAHLSVEKVYLPLAVAIAALAGSLALFVALDNAFFALGRHLPSGLGSGRWLSPFPAAICSLVVLWRLGLPAVTGTLAKCQVTSKRDRVSGDPVAKRTMRGIWGAVLVLPILVAGLWTGTPLGAWATRWWGSGS